MVRLNTKHQTPNRILKRERKILEFQEKVFGKKSWERREIWFGVWCLVSGKRLSMGNLYLDSNISTCYMGKVKNGGKKTHFFPCLHSC